MALLCALRLKVGPQVAKATPFRYACKLYLGYPKISQKFKLAPIIRGLLWKLWLEASVKTIKLY